MSEIHHKYQFPIDDISLNLLLKQRSSGGRNAVDYILPMEKLFPGKFQDFVYDYSEYF